MDYHPRYRSVCLYEGYPNFQMNHEILGECNKPSGEPRCKQNWNYPQPFIWNYTTE